MIGAELLRYQKNQLYNISDVETNGLNLYESLPWQISYCVTTSTQIQKTVTRYIRWPNFKMNDDAARITRFNMATYLERAEDPELVLKDYEEVLFDPSVIFSGHNILAYDSYIIQRWRNKLGRSTDWSFLQRCIDTNLLMKAIQKGFTPPSDKKYWLSWQYQVLNYRQKGLKSSLGFSCRHFQIPYDEKQAHDAGYDVRVNSQVLNKMIWAIEI